MKLSLLQSSTFRILYYLAVYHSMYRAMAQYEAYPTVSCVFEERNKIAMLIHEIHLKTLTCTVVSVALFVCARQPAK